MESLGVNYRGGELPPPYPPPKRKQGVKKEVEGGGDGATEEHAQARRGQDLVSIRCFLWGETQYDWGG